MASKMKLESYEVTIDPVLERVAFVEKKIGDKVYEAFVDSNSVRNNELQCFPDSSMQIDPNTGDWKSYPQREIRVGDYKWVMSYDDFKTIEWVK